MFTNAMAWRLACCAALFLGAAGSAQAIPAYWDDWAGSDGYLVNSSTSPYSYTHNLLDEDFHPGIDAIWGAELTIRLYDDSLFDGGETASFSLQNGSWTPSQNVNLLSVLFGFHFDVADLLSGGTLNVRINADSGDFRFQSSHLAVWGNSGSATAVPEPATLTLLGFGLLAIGFVARRRRT